MKKEIKNSFCMFEQTNIDDTYNPLLIERPKILPPTPPPIKAYDPILRAQKKFLSSIEREDWPNYFPLEDIKKIGLETT